jgi:glucose dehydrogenase
MTPARTRMTARACSGITLLVAAGLLVAGCSSSSAPAGSTVTNPKAATPAGSWPDPNGDLANTRVAPDSVISAANVSGLREAWAFKLTGLQLPAGIAAVGALTAPPVVQDGVVYLQDQAANVYALALATGKLKWEYQVNVPAGPRRSSPAARWDTSTR